VKREKVRSEKRIQTQKSSLGILGLVLLEKLCFLRRI